MSRSKKIMALFLSIVMVLGLLPASAFAANDTSAFSDVKTSAWYHEDVQYVSENGLMKGTGENLFSPDATTTRGMIVTILYRLEGEPSPTGACPFQDVASGKYYEKAITWAAENGIVSGFSADTFGPDQNITREQMAAILYRYATYKKYDVSAAGDLSKFPDADKVSSYAVDAMKWANAAGLINGSNDGKLYPAGNATRAQVAAILTRFCKNIAAQCTVTFQLNYGSEGTYTTLKVAKGDTITAPKAPTRSGYTFSSWSEKTSGSAFDFKTPIEKDITLYAQWNKKSSSGGSSSTVHYYTVTFDALANDATDVPEAQQVRSGEVATEPGAPSRSGYIFNGWYVDSDCTEKYNFTTPVAKNITLYAGWHQNIDNLEDDKIDRGDIEDMLTSGKIDVIFDDYGNIRTIDGSFTDKKVNSKQDAAEVLNSAGSLFSYDFDGTADKITSQSIADGVLEESFYRYSPTVDGIPVLGSQIILSTKDNGEITGLFNSYNDAINYVNTSPDLNAEEAANVAVKQLLDDYSSNKVLTYDAEVDTAGEYADAIKESIVVDPALMIYAADDTPLLVYSVHIDNSKYFMSQNSGKTKNDDDMTPVDSPVEGDDIGYDIALAAENDGEKENFSGQNKTDISYIDISYYIYANGNNAGEIYKTINNIENINVTCKANDVRNKPRIFNADQDNDGKNWLRDTARNLETYKTTFGGFLWTHPQLPGELVSFKRSISKTAVSAHANMAAVYDFYKNSLNRNSFDGNGAKIVVSYDYDNVNLVLTGNYSNAFWDSSLQQMVFGDAGNYAAALDVAGHEFTHAVINYVVGDGSTHTLTYSGESGALNEAYADILGNLIEGKTGNDSGRWLLGEDSDNAVRSMASPSSYGQPEHYNNRADTDNKGKDNDYGGVHTNSGIFNFAAYRMMTDRRTSDIAQTTWAKVFYRSLYRLTEDATFLEARGAVVVAAKTLGFTAEQQQAIKDAFDAVGITEPDGIRIVLTWGETPSDLDSHLVGPGINGGERFHTAFYQRTYYADGTYDSNSSKYVADLDYDDTTSYGPEVTTIHMLRPGEYYFFVHDYSNGSSETSTEMAHSAATVKVYKGSSGTPISTFNVEPSSSGTYWNVFKLTIGSGGTIEDITIDPINTYGAVETLS